MSSMMKRRCCPFQIAVHEANDLVDYCGAGQKSQAG
jgi:hypothetical protein